MQKQSLRGKASGGIDKKVSSMRNQVVVKTSISHPQIRRRLSTGFKLKLLSRDPLVVFEVETAVHATLE